MARIEEYESEGNIIFKFLTRVFFGLLIMSLIWGSFYIINPGEAGVLVTLGSLDNNVKLSGLHFKFPFIQSVNKMETRTLKYEADASAASSDLQIVTAKIATNFHLNEQTVPTLYRDLGVNYADRIIQPMEQEIVKATTSKYTAEQLITKREEVRLEIKNIFTQRLQPRGIIVEEVSIVNFDFSPSFNQAIEAKVTQEQQSLAAKNKLSQIEFEAQQAAARALGVQKSLIAEATGQAESIRIINEQLSKSPEYVNYLTVQKWDGHLSLVTGGATPLINLGNMTR